MIIKPDMGGRIFWATAGVTLLITGCSMSALAFPVGVILLCICLPLAVCSFGYAFGVTQIRVDEEGIFQRNFFFMSKNFKWAEIESAKIESVNFNRTDSSGWTTRGTRTNMVFVSNGKKIYVNAGDSGPEGWWGDLREMAMGKLGEKFEK